MGKIDNAIKQAYLEKLELIKSGKTFNPNESASDIAARVFLAKNDIRYCVNYYLSHYATAESAEFQVELAEAVKKSKTIKALVRWGRGLAKSVWCDVIIPFWLWINDETNFFVLIGNNLDKAKILLSDLQAEFEANPRIIQDFGHQVMRGDWTKGFFRLKNGFIAKALGMGQSPRGLRVGSRRPDLISADDLEDKETVKNPQRQKEVVKWIEQDVIPTMDGARRRYLHPNNDFAPVTIQNMLERRHKNWHLSQVNAYDPETYEPAWPAKYSATYYKELEQDIGTIAAHAEYNNEGMIEGEIFKEEMIQWGKRPRLDHFDVLMGVWDVAYSGNNDYNAVPVWGLKDRQLWKIKQFCKQCKMASALSFMYEYQESLPNGVSILWMVEKQFWNEPVQDAIEEAEMLYGYSLNILVIERPRMDKFMRILTMHPLYQGKRIMYADSEREDTDMKVANAQLFGIDYGYHGHDDAPDADEQTLHQLLQVIRTGAADSNIRTVSRAKVIAGQKNRF